MQVTGPARAGAGDPRSDDETRKKVRSAAELQGVEIVGRGIVVEDRDAVMQIGRSVYERYTGPWSDAIAPAVEAMGAKRFAVRIEVDKMVTWDHTKLGGVY